MRSITTLFRIGVGPSSSHTMGPARAAAFFKERWPAASRCNVELHGSLAATGKGHGTDVAIRKALGGLETEIVWLPDVVLPRHPNGMRFTAFAADGSALAAWEAFSVGGGTVEGEGVPNEDGVGTYDLSRMEDLLAWCEREGLPLWRHAELREGERLWEHLRRVWEAMTACQNRGLAMDGALPGGLHLARKARSFIRKSQGVSALPRRTAQLAAYALAVAEENAAGGEVVTAPTCGSCGVLPAVLRYLTEGVDYAPDEVLKALATAGLIGAVVRENASISGAEVGCQGEIGTACAMAAGAAAWLFGGTPRQVECAAEMALEHHLGLTCDPVMGLVQIPCIERNAFAAMRALDCAEYALLSDGSHRITFDQVVRTMMQTGADLAQAYRETSRGGLAAIHSEG